MKFVYMPFSILARSVGTRLGKAAFHTVWGKLGESEEPPHPASGRISLARVAGSAALEAATMAAIGAVIDQVAARAFHQLVGAWPEKPPED
jgi:hypothetical protein